MKSSPPLSNGLALLITAGAAATFFILLMMLPDHHTNRTSSPSLSGESKGSGESPAALFASRCSQCHALPALMHRSPEEWRILVLKMNRYMNQTGHLSMTEDQAREVTRYIVENQK
ncbi:MAG: cytochrome c [Nitrospiraceae bacterium]|nr:cytochrome c [Nitrospiraceae bacterium]